MSTVVNYSPTTAIGQAMFNFDAFGMTNYKLSGTVRVSVSDGFTFDDWYYSGGALDAKFILGFTDADSEVPWTPEMTSNIEVILGVYSNFANISFSAVTDYDTVGSWSNADPQDVGAANVSDINITFCNAPDTSWLGQSGSRYDSILGYTGAAGDIFLNANTPFFGGDFTFGEYTKITQVLMHEIGHSLGLSHPFSSIDSYGVPVITADFAATQYLGFDQLGFRTSSAADMNKEYFTIMSYDDQNPSPYINAYTPMILDLIALQQAYGEGSGTHGSGNDTILAGTVGYRSYFDTGGIDTVDASMYADGAYLQMGVTITGASHLVGVLMRIDDAIDTIVNAGDPQSLRWFYGEYENASGSTAEDLIVGNVLNNQILGWGGRDYIQGAAGNDTLNGGAGADTMEGGTDNDTYVVDNAGDTVTELAAQGIDLVQSSITYTLTPNVEHLVLTGASAINGTGNTLNNTLTGNIAANILNGGAGNDTLLGGGGNDTYFVTQAGDVVTELTGEGIDLVKSGITTTLKENVEKLTLTGTTAIDGTGNELNNALTGNSAVNTLSGLAGADTLNGGAGTDTMLGGLGNDTYVVDNAGDIVTELAAQGIDLVQSSIAYTLTPNVEKLTLTGTAAISGTGNGMNNSLLGNAAANRLTGLSGADTLNGDAGNDTMLGGAGKDILTGGLGNDFFVFNTALNASTNIDTLTDYTAANDTIRLENSIFTLLTATGALNAANFVVGTAAADANDYLVYNSSSGALYYDADANGAGGAVQVAAVYSTGTTPASLSAAEFVVI